MLALALVLAIPPIAFAQLFDSGWRRVSPADLEDLDISGGDVRINNLLIAGDEHASQQPGTLATYTFSLAATKRGAGARSVLVEIVGMKADNTPTITSLIVDNWSGSPVKRTSTDTHRFVAFPAEVGATSTYFVRVIVQ